MANQMPLISESHQTPLREIIALADGLPPKKAAEP